MLKKDDVKMLEALICNTEKEISMLSNASSYINEHMDDVCWVGFYLAEENEDLYLAPFQGKTACITIKKGRGVCGKSADLRKTVSVYDVTKFPGYISCDAAARSEIVVPIMNGERLYGVLDIDSETTGRFIDKEIGLVSDLSEFAPEEKDKAEEIMVLQELVKVIEGWVKSHR